MVALTWISCHGLPSKIRCFSQMFGVQNIFSHRNDDNMAVRLKQSSLKRCTKTFQNSVVERSGHAKVLIRLFFGQVLLSATFPSTPASWFSLNGKMLRWERSAMVLGAVSWLPPFFCFFSGECLPTAKTQLGWAVNSDEPALFLHSKFIHWRRCVFIWGI